MPKWLIKLALILGKEPKSIMKVADALCCQSGTSPQFGIPTIQIGHQTYADTLVKNEHATSIMTVEGFIKPHDDLENWQEHPEEKLLSGSGIRKDWQTWLENKIEMFLEASLLNAN